ncbi:MAG TPA: tryptophan--tRNA ligase [Candidatus Dormibacteraeota bacterium]|jgi:tryptophanyl-tRNA synthetase|nr:tryptophan--tRNA ligase [Candidatus Dormibacteraeota bacterium]
MQSATKPRVFSGIQPSGGLHLGNYLGAIRNWVRDQDKYDNIFCIVDLHAITLPQDPRELRENTLDLAAIFLASGINEEQAMFVQSHIAAHAELAWIFECFTPIGWLERMTQFKDRTARQGRERIGAGVLTYPSLMAADIMLYDAKYVPVGEDQRQHLEYTRDIGQRMNQRFGNLLTIPEALIQKAGAEIKGLDDPEKKMSKSLAAETPGHAIFMLDPPDVIRRKLSRAQTDAEPAVTFPAGAGVRNLLEIYRTIKGEDWPAVEQEFAGKSYSVLKSAVADAVIEALTPIQRRYREIRADDAALMQQLRRSADRLAPIANTTLRRVQEAVGLR